MTAYILSRSAEFSAGWCSGRTQFQLQHLELEMIPKLRPVDSVTILGNWDEGMARAGRVRIEKALHDSGAHIMNGMGSPYDWGYPPPWEHDGNEPGSAIPQDDRSQEDLEAEFPLALRRGVRGSHR